MKLGKIINSIRNQEVHQEIRDDLTALGVDLTPQINFKPIYDGLMAYKQIHGHVKVPVTFMVPENDYSRFPENTWGINLGNHLHQIRSKNYWSKHREELEALGVNYEVKPIKRVGFEVIFSALQSYKAL